MAIIVALRQVVQTPEGLGMFIADPALVQVEPIGTIRNVTTRQEFLDTALTPATAMAVITERHGHGIIKVVLASVRRELFGMEIYVPALKVLRGIVLELAHKPNPSTIKL